jgi:transcriptional regulator of acetoin/glycerol metabolism
VEHVPESLFAVLRYQRRGDREANRVAVERSLKLTGGNVKAAATLLGVSRNALMRPRNLRQAVR